MSDFKILNDLMQIKKKIKTVYKGIPFDDALPLLRNDFNNLADKYNTTNVEIWFLFFQLDIMKKDYSD